MIPLRLEECEAPERLRRWQWVDLFQRPGYERLLRALRACAESLGLGVHPWEPEMILIPAGEFWMGTDRLALELAGIQWEDLMRDERPYHQVHLAEARAILVPLRLRADRDLALEQSTGFGEAARAAPASPIAGTQTIHRRWTDVLQPLVALWADVEKPALS